MTIQTGLGAEEIVRAHGGWPLVSAVTFMSGVRHGDTHVEYELDTETWLGPYAATTTFERVQAIERLLVDAGLRARAFADLRPAQWSKLIFNATVNTVAALTGLPHVAAFAAVSGSTDLGHLVCGLMDEGKRVAAAAGVDLHEDPWEMNVLAVKRGETEQAHGAYAHVPSMLEDVNSQRRTEVDFITGALVREAERLGVPVPLHEAMYRLVRAKETSW
jgi:2-dehydropantoate 2-reductase